MNLYQPSTDPLTEALVLLEDAVHAALTEAEGRRRESNVREIERRLRDVLEAVLSMPRPAR